MPDPTAVPATADDLHRRLVEAAAGTPYVVTRTERGSDLTREVDAEGARTSRSLVVHAIVPRPGLVEVVDDVRGRTRSVGGSGSGGGFSREYGRVARVGFEQTWGFDEHGRFGKQGDVRFDTREGRRLVEAAARALGMEQRRGAVERAGIGFAVVGGVGAVVTVVVLLVLLVLGRF